MNITPLFTVVVPVMGDKDGLLSSLQSVLAQTVSDFEVLVITPDGKTADSVEKTVASAITDPRLEWVTKVESQQAMRDVVLRRARGKLIAMLPCGDILLQDHLERFAHLFARPKVQWACSRPIWARDDGLLVPFFGNLKFGSAALHFRRGCFVPTGAVVYRRSLLDAVGGWPSQPAANADWALWQRMFKDLAADAVAHLRDPTLLHFRPNNRPLSQWAPRPMPYLAALADSGEFWPAALRLRLKPVGRAGPAPDQAWARMQEDPARFCRRVRKATAELQDEIAWTAVTSQPFFKAV